MKKIYFLLFVMLGMHYSFAANCVSATQVAADYKNQTVTFKLTWNACNGIDHLNKAWCFIDFQPVDAAGNGGTWQRAIISEAPSVTNGTYSIGNTTGFYVTGVNGQSATVTVKLSNAASSFNWCAFATDLPAYVIADNGTYRLQGTAPFVLTAANGETQIVHSETLPAANLQIEAVALTDATNAPSMFCPYTGSDLYRDATHLCGHRPGGAKNWEAWIKDSRDGKLYRIVQLSNGLWTMDDYLNYKGHSAAVSELCGSNADPNGTEYWRHALASTYSTLCPSGWRLPNQTEFELTINSWNQYLSKIFKITGETCWTSWTSSICQSGYISFVVSDCLGYGAYGQRLTSITPISYLSNQKVCLSCQSSEYVYSGYARCVR